MIALAWPACLLALLLYLALEERRDRQRAARNARFLLAVLRQRREDEERL